MFTSIIGVHTAQDEDDKLVLTHANAVPLGLYLGETWEEPDKTSIPCSSNVCPIRTRRWNEALSTTMVSAPENTFLRWSGRA